MTTTPTPSINVVTPSGVSVGPWPTGWTYADQADVRVYVETAGRKGADLSLGTDFTVSGATPLVNGGSVSLDTAVVPSGGWRSDHRLILRRRTARRQSIALPDSEGHKPRATEQALDKAMRIAEEDRDQLGRALTLPASSGDGGDIPWSAGDGERFLTIGADGKPGATVKPDDFDGLNKVNRNADNVTPAFIDQVPYRLSAAAQIRAVGDKLDGLVQLEDYYATGMDWADVFDVAFADVDALNIAGTIYGPADNVMLTRPVGVPFGRTRIEGQDKGATVFRIAHGGDGFVFKAAGGGSYLNSGIAMCSIERTLGGERVAGSAVVFDGVGAAYATDIEMLGFYRGVSFIGNNRACMVYDCGLSDIYQTIFHVEGGGNQYISRTDAFQNIERPDSIGLALLDTEGLWADQVKISRAGDGLKIGPPAGKRVQDLYMNLCSFDASHRNGAVFDINAVGSIIRNLMINETSFSASGARGVVATGAAGRLRTIKFSNSFINLNQDDGAFLDAGTDWYFNQTAIQNNGNGGGIANRDGIRLGNCGVVVVDECPFSSFDPGDPTWNPVRQKYAVHATPTFAGDFRMSKSNLNDQITAPVLNEGTGTFSVTNCPGYNRYTGIGKVVTVSVPGDFTTIAAAVEAAANADGPGGTYNIQVANGTYTAPPPVLMDKPLKSQVRIIGNVANPSLVTLEVATSGVTLFTVKAGGSGVYINGLRLRHTNVADRANTVGILADELGKVHLGGAMIVDGFFWDLFARRKGAIRADAGGQYLNAGDACALAYLGGKISAPGCALTGADDALSSLGSGAVCEGGELDVTGATLTGNKRAGLHVISGYVRAEGTTLSNNINDGVLQDGGVIDFATACTAANNGAFGYRRQAGGIALSLANLTGAGNASGLFREFTTPTAGSGFAGFAVASPNTDASLRLEGKGNGSVELRSWGGKVVEGYSSAANPTNYLGVRARTAGGAVGLEARSSVDANVDIQLTPLGTGLVKFGALTANADAPVTGYVSIRTASGATVKLAVIT